MRCPGGARAPTILAPVAGALRHPGPRCVGTHSPSAGGGSAQGPQIGTHGPNTVPRMPTSAQDGIVGQGDADDAEERDELLARLDALHAEIGGLRARLDSREG